MAVMATEYISNHPNTYLSEALRKELGSLIDAARVIIGSGQISLNPRSNLSRALDYAAHTYKGCKIGYVVGARMLGRGGNMYAVYIVDAFEYAVRKSVQETDAGEEGRQGGSHE